MALLAVAVLLLNPLSACAKVSLPYTPAHPCCPEKPTPPADCHSAACQCLFIEQAPVTVPANADPEVALWLPDLASPSAARTALAERPVYTPVLPGLQDSYLSIHQLLL